MFREPFFSDEQAVARASAPLPSPKNITADDAAISDLTRIESILNSSTRGICVVGALATHQETHAVRKFIARLGWVTFADPLSGLRQDYSSDQVMTYGDLSLIAPLTTESLPDSILHIGGRLVSKRISALLAPSQNAAIVSLTPSHDYFNPNDGIGEHFIAPISSLEGIKLSQERVVDHSFKDAFIARDRAIASFLEKALPENDGRTPSEPAIVRAISREIPESHILMLGNSMPIRDFELFASARRAPLLPLANRGASGIDGVLATAVGAAVSSARPLTLVIGDLSLLHDLNSLSLIRNLRTPFSIIAINNDGGGIFSLLPVAKTEHFEQLFATPHGLRFEDFARGFGISYSAPHSMDEFIRGYRSSLSTIGGSLLEISTSRHENAELHRALNSSILEILTRSPLEN
jgi:2-succinyl-5-enolpyruvyl-6-hydroxy-3-cyclohexene-1-carboxylate synthase